MSQKYEKPLIIPFCSDKYDTARGMNCIDGSAASPQCMSGNVANNKCDVGSTASRCQAGSAG